MIIGITGKNAAGKGEASKHLERRGYHYFSLSDQLREEATKQGIGHEREKLISFGNSLREKNGAGYLASIINERITSLKKEGKSKFVVDSIRSPGEVKELSKNLDFVLLGIDAISELRFDRMKARGRGGDAQSLDDFKAMEEKENQKKESSQQLDSCLRLAKFIVNNNGSLEELFLTMDSLLGEKNGKREKRVSWEEYFMNIAKQIASRSTCDRKHVGAVIVRDRTILSTGYNGSIRGMPHCDDVGHMMEAGHCVATIHAESNAILQAAKNGVAIGSSEIYITASPCWHCFKMVANSGIKKIYYGEFYRDERIFSVAQQIGIELVHIKVDQEQL